MSAASSSRLAPGPLPLRDKATKNSLPCQGMTEDSLKLIAPRPNKSSISSRKLDSVAYDALRGGKIGWELDERAAPTFASSIESARNTALAARQEGAYVDVHVWRFTLSSFRLLIEDLFGLGAISLRESSIIPWHGNEFFVALSRKGRGPGASRDELAADILRELSMVKPSV